MNVKEQEILRQATAALETNLGINIKIEPMVYATRPKLPMTRVDAYITIKLPENEMIFRGQVEPTIMPTILEQIVVHDAEPEKKMLWITNYITPKYAKTLKKFRIHFIDTTGNAYINEPPIYIDIQGRKPEDMKWPKLAEKGTIAQAGLRAVYALLIKNEFVNAPYREIANEAGVALGTIDRVFKDLKRRKYIIEIKDGRRMLTNKRDMIEWWVNAYIEKLRPKLLIGRYETDDYEQFQNVDLEKLNARWGGEKAAEIITNYLRPEIFTIYTRKPLNNLIMQLKLRARPTGRIEIREQFWNFVDTRRSNLIVHPILVYADLLATGEARNIETAKLIYEAIIAMEN
jgi:hypothetical protein